MVTEKIKYCITELAIFLILLLASSCSDDLVTPQDPSEGIDTVEMYEWDIDTISGFLLYNIYVADSNNIFFEGPGNSMIYYNGKNYSPISYNDPVFSSKCISGFNQNNVFIGGTRYISPGPARPRLKVWNGSSIMDYGFPNDTGEGIYNLTITGYNQAWMHNGFNDIYYFDNGNFTRYTVDTLIISGVFYVSPSNEVYLFTSRLVQPPPHSINIGYKLQNNYFQIIYRDSTINGITIMDNTYFPSPPYIFRGGYKTINMFNNDNWFLLLNTYNFYLDGVCGNSLNNLICYGENEWYWQDMYLWNGQKWALEKNFYYLMRRGQFPIGTQASRMFMVDNKIYMNYNNFDIYTSYLIKGKPILRKEDKK